MSFDPFADHESIDEAGTAAAIAAPKKPAVMRNALILVGVLIVVGRVYLSTHEHFPGLQFFRRPPHFWARLAIFAAMTLVIAGAAYIGKRLLGAVGALSYALVSSLLAVTVAYGLSINQTGVSEQNAIIFPIAGFLVWSIFVGRAVANKAFAAKLFWLTQWILIAACCAWCISWLAYSLPMAWWGIATLAFFAAWLGVAYFMQRDTARRRSNEPTVKRAAVWAYLSTLRNLLIAGLGVWLGFFLEQVDRLYRFKKDMNEADWGYAYGESLSFRGASPMLSGDMTWIPRAWLRGGWYVPHVWIVSDDGHCAVRCILPLLADTSDIYTNVNLASYGPNDQFDLGLPTTCNLKHVTFIQAGKLHNDQIASLVSQFPGLQSIKLARSTITVSLLDKLGSIRKAAPASPFLHVEVETSIVDYQTLSRMRFGYGNAAKSDAGNALRLAPLAAFLTPSNTQTVWLAPIPTANADDACTWVEE